MWTFAHTQMLARVRCDGRLDLKAWDATASRKQAGTLNQADRFFFREGMAAGEGQLKLRPPSTGIARRKQLEHRAGGLNRRHGSTTFRSGEQICKLCATTCW
jgi:hypothetical protein